MLKLEILDTSVVLGDPPEADKKPVFEVSPALRQAVS